MADLARSVIPRVLLLIGLVVFVEWFVAVLVGQNGPSDLIAGLLGQADPSTSMSVILGVAEIGGVILGLYFAVVGVVASTVYADAPEDVRALFVWERVNRAYASLVAAVVAVALILLGVQLMGWVLTIGTLMALVAVAVVAILGLVWMAPRTFLFFDPLTVASPLLKDFTAWLDRSRAGGSFWLVEDFQALYGREGSRSINQLESVIGHSVESGRVQRGTLLGVTLNTLATWAAYASAKEEIPFASKWYEHRYQHPKWSAAPHHQASLSLRARTPLTPELVPHRLGIDESFANCVSLGLDEMIRGGNATDAVQVLSTSGQVARRIAGRLQLEEFVLLWDTVTECLWDSSNSPSLLQAANAWDDAEQLALIDAWAAIAVQAPLGLVGAQERLSANQLAAKVSDGLATRYGIYEQKLPLSTLGKLDRLRSEREFELKAEGKQVTPDWFATQLCARSLCASFDQAVESLLSVLEDVLSRAESMKDDHPVQAAFVLSRAREALSKWEAHLPSLISGIEAYSSLMITPDEFWPKKDPERHVETLAKLRRRSSSLVAKTLLEIRDSTPTGDLPDVFGQFYSQLADEIFEAILEGDEESFRTLYPPFVACLDSARKRALQDVDGPSDVGGFLGAVEPIVLTFELSGYALFFSELDGKAFGGLVQRIWDSLIDASDDPVNLVSDLVGLVAVKDSTFSLYSADIGRTGRRQQFESVMRERGLLGERWIDPFEDRETLRHQSAMVRAVLGGYGSSASLYHLFVVAYLAKRAEADELTLSHAAERLQSRIEAEEMSGQNDG